MIWRWLKHIPGRVFFWVAGGVLFLVALFLGRRQPKRGIPVSGRVDFHAGRADALEEQRAVLSEEITQVDREIARVTVESQGLSADEIVARAKARRK
jgi:hypothetical protein